MFILYFEWSTKALKFDYHAEKTVDLLRLIKLMKGLSC